MGDVRTGSHDILGESVEIQFTHCLDKLAEVFFQLVRLKFLALVQDTLNVETFQTPFNLFYECFKKGAIPQHRPKQLPLSEFHLSFSFPQNSFGSQGTSCSCCGKTHVAPHL